jgi:N utilization substance protein A
VAREPGYRSKIAVVSHTDGVDPVGACVGPRGSRVRMVVSELRGEKIDIIPYNEEPARFVAKALSPARVREVLVDDEDKQATVIVPDDQLSLAIGRDGQNARLAARLTGWRVDIKSETEFSQEDDEEYQGEEEFDGRCLAVLSNGRRCPNAAIAGSTYCGLPQHQALSRFETSQVAVLGGLTDEEVASLADPDADEAVVSELVEKAAATSDVGQDEEAPAEEAEGEQIAEAKAEPEEAVAEVAEAEPEGADGVEQPAESAEAEVEPEEATSGGDGAVEADAAKDALSEDGAVEEEPADDEAADADEPAEEERVPETAVEEAE